METACLDFSQAPDKTSQDQQMKTHEPDDHTLGMQNLLNGQFCSLVEPMWI